MAGWHKVREHVWRDADGSPVLRHVKYLTRDGGVAFPWKHRRFWPETGIARWFDGKGADDGIVAPLLYPLDVFAHADRTQHCYVVEGERDADSMIRAGVLAVTAGGVFEFKPNHARLFVGWGGRITVVRDNDAPGAVGALRTLCLLREVAAIPATRLRIARGRCTANGADAHDHLEAGHSVEEFVSESVAAVYRIAGTATPEEMRQAGYDRAPRHADDPGWVVATPDETAQLTGWKPRRAS